jgi:hypothetical protein
LIIACHRSVLGDQSGAEVASATGRINERKLPAPGSTERTKVNGLHVFVTKNNTLGVPVGTQIIVAHADSTAVRF